MPARATVQIETPHGPARVHLHRAGTPKGALMLGPGAGGGIEAPDQVAATGAAIASSPSAMRVSACPAGM